MIATPKFLSAAALAALAACAPAPGEAAGADPHEEAQAAVPSDRVDIPATVRRNLGITFAQVEVRRVAQTLRVPGAFELQPLARHEYRMALPGRVEMLVDQYDSVEPGRPLFRYQSPAWPELLHEIILGEQTMATALAQIEVAEAKIGEAERNLELTRSRIEALAKADFKEAELEVQAAELEASLPRLNAELRLVETNLANARRTREHALHRAATAAGFSEAELEVEILVGDELLPAYQTIDWIVVRATKPGVVEALAVTDGAFVEAPSTVLSTIDPSKVRFRAMALQADLTRLMDAGEARIVPPSSSGVSVVDGVEAEMTIGLEANPKERTVTLLATPQEPAEWIRPGVSAFLEVVLDPSAAPALAVPRSAVVLDGLTHVFFRRDPNDPNKAIRVEADMGTSDGRWVVLNSGVMRGDEVVLAGAFELKLATQEGAGGVAGGHTHADGSVHADS